MAIKPVRTTGPALAGRATAGPKTARPARNWAIPPAPGRNSTIRNDRGPPFRIMEKVARAALSMMRNAGAGSFRLVEILAGARGMALFRAGLPVFGPAVALPAGAGSVVRAAFVATPGTAPMLASCHGRAYYHDCG